MSLRQFHIFFIATALGLTAFLGVWSARMAAAGLNGPYAALAVSSLIGLAVGVPYFFWFLRKGSADARA